MELQLQEWGSNFQAGSDTKLNQTENECIFNKSVSWISLMNNCTLAYE